METLISPRNATQNYRIGDTKLMPANNEDTFLANSCGCSTHTPTLGVMVPFAVNTAMDELPLNEDDAKLTYD